MKKRFSLLLCLIMAVMMLTACGKRQKAAEKAEIIPMPVGSVRKQLKKLRLFPSRLLRRLQP